MKPSLLAALAAALLAVLLLTTRRRSKPVSFLHGHREVAALNRDRIAEVRRQSAQASTPEEVPLPIGARQEKAFLRQLLAWSRGDRTSRLRAMTQARRWVHPSVLPLLRLGLRDADPAVMRQAALAMEAFRGKPRRPVHSPPQATALPRNVARTR